MFKTILNKHFPIILLSILYILFAFNTFKLYGVTTDEPLEYQSAEKLLNFYQKGNFRTFLDGEPENLPEGRHEPLNSMYYRGHLLFHSYLYSAKDFFELHLMNILYALPLFIVSYYVFLRLFGKWYLAIIAPILLLLDPRITGHIPANPKDFPFTSVVLMYVLLTSLFGLKKYGILINMVLGALLALVLAIRPIGISVLVSILIVYVFFAVKDKSIIPIKNAFSNFLIQGITSFLVLIFTWPFFANNPIGNFFNFLFYGANYPDWSGSVLFNGEYIPYDKIPWEYLFVWLFNTTPVLHLFLIILSFFLLKKLIKINLIQNILLIVILNFIVYFIFSPLIYNGIRHYLFLTSLITLYCAYVLAYFFKNYQTLKRSWIYSLVIVVLTISLTKDNLTLFPYQNIYFNELQGGLKNLGQKYDTDYWLQSRLEASNWVAKNLNTYGEKVYVCNMSEIINYYQPRIETVKDKDDATISICDPRREKERVIDGEIIYTVEREGIPLTNIRRLN